MAKINKHYLLNSLLKHNYFPMQKKKKEELPPIFDTSSLSIDVADIIYKISYTRKKAPYNGFDQIDYKMTRFNNVPRLLSIPHPKSYIDLCFVLSENWEKYSYIEDNIPSLIKPKVHKDDRVIIMDYELSSIKMKRTIHMSFGKRFVVHTDISNFYPSIYSHSIPWALVGIKTAKKDTTSTKWFNKIDMKQRNIKRNETLGVAIGPATSNIVAEIILAKIDEQLKNDFKYVRFIDDYTCYCKTQEEAENFIKILSDCLNQYKLNLNYKKTYIEPLPVQVNSDWVNDLNTHLPCGDEYNFQQVMNFLDYALELQKKHKDGSVLKYAVKTILPKCNDKAKEYLLDYVQSLSYFYPVLIPILSTILDELNSFFSYYHIEKILEQSIINKQSDGMCWMLYSCKKHSVCISDKIATQIIETEDCMAITTLYLFDEHKSKVIDFANRLDKEDLYQLDTYWILIYQLFFEGEISNFYIHDKCSEETFEVLKNNGVSFLIGI